MSSDICFAYELLLERQPRKRLLQRIVIGNKKWVNPSAENHGDCSVTLLSHTSAEYPWLNSHDVRLVGTAWRNLSRASETVWKHHRWAMETATVQRKTWCCQSGEKIPHNVEIENFTSPAVLTKCVSVWFSFISLNGKRAGWPTLQPAQSSEKLDRLMGQSDKYIKFWPSLHFFVLARIRTLESWGLFIYANIMFIIRYLTTCITHYQYWLVRNIFTSNYIM